MSQSIDCYDQQGLKELDNEPANLDSTRVIHILVPFLDMPAFIEVHTKYVATPVEPGPRA